MNEIAIKRIAHHLTWDIRHQVMWPNKSIAYIKLPEDEYGLHFGLYVGKQLVSIISVFIKGEEAQFRKFATLVEEQGKGYGSKLLAFIFDQLAQLNISKVWCNARIDKATYYQRFGLFLTDKTFSKGGIRYVIMEKNFKSGAEWIRL